MPSFDFGSGLLCSDAALIRHISGALLNSSITEKDPTFVYNLGPCSITSLLTMARYYFDLRDGDELVPDEEGMELPYIEAVQNEAAQALVDLARDIIKAGPSTGETRKLAIEVRDDDGSVMLANFQFELHRLN